MRPILIAVLTAPLVLPTHASGSDTATRIVNGFARLGMEERQGACYGRVVTRELDPDQAEEAAAIVESAGNSADVRKGVKDSGLDMVQAFLAAQTACGS